MATETEFNELLAPLNTALLGSQRLLVLLEPKGLLCSSRRTALRLVGV